jgi:C-terminal processing protease CtpA/Prc
LKDGKTGYLSIFSFVPDQTEAKLRQEIENPQAAGPLSGLIMDVRPTKEGNIDTILGALAMLSSGGEIGTLKSRSQQVKQIVPGGKTLRGVDQLTLVVLVGDRDGVMEMFTSSLRLLRQTKVVGQATSGNEEFMSVESHSDGSQLFLPVSIY